MRPSEQYPVPADIALLYDFVNSLDLRSFVEHGTPHGGGDELATSQRLEQWLRRHALLGRGDQVSTEDHDRALELRSAVRRFVEVEPAARAEATVITDLNRASAPFPLAVQAQRDGSLRLQPEPSSPNKLGRVLGELHMLAATGRLDRLKMCASDECAWIFYDQSKPANRRWCSTALCGNRQKTREYRRRHRVARAGPTDPDPGASHRMSS
jgi:predicted RNA-binding Zn ribbon-like protein